MDDGPGLPLLHPFPKGARKGCHRRFTDHVKGIILKDGFFSRSRFGGMLFFVFSWWVVMWLLRCVIADLRHALTVPCSE
jgi:hypothetical protein